MSIQVNVNDVVEFKVLGRLHGQRTINVFHYLVTSHEADPADPRSIFSHGPAFLAAFQDAIVSPLLSFASEEWMCETITVQKIYPERMIPQFVNANSPGVIEDDSCPTAVAAVLTKQTTLTGPRFQGRVFLAGVPIAFTQNSMLTDVAMANLSAGVRAGMQSVLTAQPADLAEVTLFPVLFHPPATLGAPAPKTPRPNPPYSGLASVVIRRILRSQRRRQVGRGI